MGSAPVPIDSPQPLFALCVAGAGTMHKNLDQVRSYLKSSTKDVEEMQVCAVDTRAASRLVLLTPATVRFGCFGTQGIGVQPARCVPQIPRRIILFAVVSMQRTNPTFVHVHRLEKSPVLKQLSLPRVVCNQIVHIQDVMDLIVLLTQLRVSRILLFT